MKCDVVFEYCSPHNGEYWYKCKTCGAWFAYYDTPERDEPIRGCKKNSSANEAKK